MLLSVLIVVCICILAGWLCPLFQRYGDNGGGFTGISLDLKSEKMQIMYNSSRMIHCFCCIEEVDEEYRKAIEKGQN